MQVRMDDETAQRRVLEASDRLFYEHGIRAVSMDAIRDASGVSLKRLYRLYPAKDRLAEATLRRRAAAFRTALDEYTAGRGSPRERMPRVESCSMAGPTRRASRLISRS